MSELPPGWTCEGQLDLTDLVDEEHIAGSMPADEPTRERHRQAWYQQLIDRRSS